MDTPRLHALTTAVPPHVFDQFDVMDAVHKEWIGRTEAMQRLLPVFRNAGILRRHSAVPMDWHRGEHGWSDRNDAYVAGALALLEHAARDCLDRAGLQPEQLDGIITVSTTGIATPSLDALLTERMGLRRDIMRLPIFGLGCAGGVLGLARAGALARAHPGKIIMFLVVELCALTFRRNDRSKSNIVATALFGDGAAAAIITTGTDGPALADWGEHTWPRSLDVMGWLVEDNGLGVLFSADIPALVRERYRGALDDYLARRGMTLGDIDAFVCHPGGAKVVAALEEVLGLQSGTLRHAREVLRDFGNMSAATVFFVLERTLAAGSRGRHILSALGPGFTAGFLTLEVA